MIYALGVISLLVGALAQVSTHTQCRDFMKNVNKTRFIGKWYAAATTRRIDDACLSWNLVVENGVLHNNVEWWDGTDLIGRKDEQPEGSIDIVLDTDYDSYAIICFGDPKTIHILTRARRAPNEVFNKVEAVLERKHIDKNKFYDVNQLVCLLPCRGLIPMDTVNATRFMGSWYAVLTSDQPDINCLMSKWTVENEVLSKYVEWRNETYHVWDKAVQPKGSIEKIVMATDYDSYAVICFGKPRSIQILTRAQQPPMEILTKVGTILEQKKINNRKFYDVNQVDCPVLDFI